MTSIKELFDAGRQQGRDHERKARRRLNTGRRNQRLPIYSPLQIVVGAGGVFEILSPVLGKISPVFSKIFGPILLAVRSDYESVTRLARRHVVADSKSIEADAKFEDYRNFLELARK